MTVLLADLTAAQIAVLANSCGPSGWKVHSWKWRVAQWLTPRLRAACNQHDVSYVAGGTDEDRDRADCAFREEIAAVAHQSGWLVCWLLEEEQPILFALVESEGGKHWHRAERGRTVEEVRAVADKRIAAGYSK